MQVSVETGEGLVRRMRVELPFERVQDGVDKRLAEITRSVRLPGFRPGKVPLKVVRARFGGEVEREVFADLVQSSFSEAVAAQALRPAGGPQIDADIDRGARRYAFTATFEVMPRIEPAALDGKVVKRPSAEVTEADVEATVERLREQRKTWTPVERAAQDRDTVTVSFTATIDGEPLPGGSGTAVPVELGSGRMIPGFEDGLRGVTAGETRTLDLTFPEGYHRGELSGRAVRFEITVDSVAEATLPPVDEDFARAFGVADGDVARFRDEVKANLDRELKKRVRARIKESVLDLLLGSHEVDLPAVLVGGEVEVLRSQMRESLGAPPNMELPGVLFEEGARRRVALGLIIGELISRQGLRADPPRVRAAVEELASTYEDPKEVIDYYYADRKRLASVESLVLEDQVIDWVLSQVTLEDEPTTLAELTAPPSDASATGPAEPT